MGRKSKILNRKFFPAGATIIEQGALTEQAYVVQSGRVEVLVKNSDGKTVKVAEIGEGGIVGEMASITEKPRSASVRAMEDSTLIILTPGELHKALQKSKKLFEKLTDMIIFRRKINKKADTKK